MNERHLEEGDMEEIGAQEEQRALQHVFDTCPFLSE